MPFTTACAEELEATGGLNDKKVATIIRESIAAPETFRREVGKAHQVILLDKDSGFAFPKAIDHPIGAAWLRGQRYKRSDA